YPELRRAHRPALLKTLPAEHRAPLRGPEGNGRFLPALRAVRLRFRAHRGSMRATAFGALRLARFTSLRFVLEAFVGEKHLFAAGEDELRPTLGTLQYFVVVFHEPLSPGPRRAGADFVPEPRIA